MVGSVNPNSIQGPSGYDGLDPKGQVDQSYVDPHQLFPYTIEFQNKPTATAPAQIVSVTQQLDSNLDWSTFQLGNIGFGDTVINVPAGRTSFGTQVDLTASLGVLVDVTANFDTSTGLATWTFTAIDPATLDVPADPLAGFLPPDVTGGEGEGFVNYTVFPKSTLASGAQINAQATVVFDQNAPLATAVRLNTIDAGPPTSSVSPLPATEPATSFPVSWSGSDDTGGSGITSYNVYVSDNGGAYTLFQSNTTQTSATFTGQDGDTYGFYSVATDNVGHVQPTPSAAQATTTVETQVSTTTAVSSDHPAPNGSVYGQTVTFTAIVSLNAGSATPTGSVQFLIDNRVFGSSVALTGGTASITDWALAAGSHAVTAVYSSDNPGFSGSNTPQPLSQIVNPAPLTITAANRTMPYGGPLPTLVAGYTGFVNGDTPASLTTPPSLTTTATAASHVSGSPYPITASGAVDTDYTISYVAGALTVTPAPLTITAVNQTMPYGGPLPTLTASYAGFVNGDTPASLSTPPTLTTTATAASPVSGNPYSITASGAVDPDYTISYVAGTLTVTSATVTAVSSQASGAYGAGTTIPITLTFSGPVAVTGLPQLALNAGAPGTPGRGATANYTSGSGTSTLTFTYSVAAGQSTSDLDYSLDRRTRCSMGGRSNRQAAPVSLTLPARARTASQPGTSPWGRSPRASRAEISRLGPGSCPRPALRRPTGRSSRAWSTRAFRRAIGPHRRIEQQHAEHHPHGGGRRRILLLAERVLGLQQAACSASRSTALRPTNGPARCPGNSRSITSPPERTPSLGPIAKQRVRPPAAMPPGWTTSSSRPARR